MSEPRSIHEWERGPGGTTLWAMPPTRRPSWLARWFRWFFKGGL